MKHPVRFIQTRKGQTIKLLDAVNICLRTAGRSAVSQLDDGSSDQANAQNAIGVIRKEILLKGWLFNTNIVSFSVNSDGRVGVDKSYLKVGFRDPNLSLRFFEGTTQQYVWDIRENDWWPTAIDKAAVVFDLDFEKIPHPFAQWIARKAADEMWSNFHDGADPPMRVQREAVKASTAAINSVSHGTMQGASGWNHLSMGGGQWHWVMAAGGLV